MKVKKIDYQDTKPFILNKHYAQRMPSISYAFGLFIDDELVGVCTFGKPASNALCEGVCGSEFKEKVYELNRLITNDGLPNNSLSFFVAKCLKLLRPDDLIIVSYADEMAGHYGYIYQATNWIYTGCNKPRTDKYTPNGKHSRHYTDEFNHLRKYRSVKHRYIYFTGRSKKKLLKKLRYKQLEYPKGDNSNYELGNRLKQKIINTKTGEIYYE